MNLMVVVVEEVIQVVYLEEEVDNSLVVEEVQEYPDNWVAS